jgi:hypothetical protein
MIPSIEDIFHSLSRGDMSFADAENFVRAHLALDSDQDNMRDVFAGLALNADLLNSPLPVSEEHAAWHAKRAYQQADAMIWERSKR